VDGAFPEGPHVLVGQDRGFVVDGAGARSAGVMYNKRRKPVSKGPWPSGWFKGGAT